MKIPNYKRKLQLWFVAMFTGLLCLAQHPGAAQTIKGKVSAADGSSLPGVNIVEKGTNTGTVTDVDGNYEINVSSPDAILVFSYVGFLTEEIAVGGQTVIDLLMVEDIQALDEIVVIGYGTVKKSDLTGAVASVSSEDLNRIPAGSVAQAIQGRASGVMVTQSGRPGGDVNLKIRGIGSINRAGEPLYIIDGIYKADINSIAPESIESLQVLKDASATAIYGADGANGVILITTKRGQAGETKVTFSSYWGINQIVKQYDMMNADEYAAFYDTVLTANNENPDVAYTDEFRQFYYGDGWQEGTNWQDEITQQSMTQNYYLNVSGGSENNNYSISGRYYTEDGILKTTGVERFNFGANSDFNIGKYIKIGETLIISRNQTRNAPLNVWNLALESSPLMRIDNLNNKEGYEGAQVPYAFQGDTVLNTGGNDKYNPVGELMVRENYSYTTRSRLTAYMEIKPLPWLSYTIEPTLGYRTTRVHNWVPSYDMGVRSNPDARLEHNFDEAFGLQLKNQLTINQSFGELNVNLIAVHHVRKSNIYNANVDGVGYNYENLNTLVQANNVIVDGRYSPSRELSYLGRLILDYKSKYLFTASVRRDGTSVFGPKNRWGTFPSFSAGWKINEDLFPAVDQISMAKIRVGWGMTGNSNINSFQYQTTLGVPDEFHAVIGNARVPALNELYSIGNPFLKWEAAEMTNIGLDVNAFRGKIQFSADYFVKNQDDLLARIEISRALGRSTDGARPWMNIAEIKNTGFEFDIKYSQMENTFKYIISANFSHAKNEVISVPEDIPGDNNLTSEGHVIGELYGYVADGIVQESDFDEDGKYLYGGNPKPGDIKFKDLNRDGLINDLDRTYIGKAVPDFTYSLNVELLYKDFDLSMFLVGMQNMQAYNQQRSTIECFEGQDMDHNKSREWAANYYRTWKPTTEWIRADLNDVNTNSAMSSWWVEDASFLRLQDIQLGYNIPQTASNYLGLGSARIYVSVKNALIFTKYKGRDPEAAVDVGNDDNPLSPGNDTQAYPIPRTFTGGIQINF